MPAETVSPSSTVTRPPASGVSAAIRAAWPDADTCDDTGRTRMWAKSASSSNAEAYAPGDGAAVDGWAPPARRRP